MSISFLEVHFHRQSVSYSLKFEFQRKDFAKSGQSEFCSSSQEDIKNELFFEWIIIRCPVSAEAVCTTLDKMYKVCPFQMITLTVKLTSFLHQVALISALFALSVNAYGGGGGGGNYGGMYCRIAES